MALVKMRRIEIVGLNSERKRLIEYLQRCGVIDVADGRGDILESRETAQSISSFEAYMSSAAEALEILSAYGAQRGGMFLRRKSIDGNAYVLSENEITRVKGRINEILRMKKTAERKKEELAAAEIAKNALKPYMALDAPIGLKGTAVTTVRLGTLEGKWDEQRLWQELRANELDDVYFELLSRSREQTAVWLLYPSERSEQYNALLAKLNLLAPQGITGDKTPGQSAEEAEKKIKRLTTQIEQLEARLAEYAEYRGEIELFYDRITVRRDKYRALSKVGITENAFFITGYAPEEACAALKEKLAGHFTVAAEIYEPDADEDIPAAFVNNGIVAPAEGITADYSMPSRGDIDPNPIMAWFYYFFFGMMFSDAGYGILMMIGCGLLGFGDFLEEGKRRVYKLFFFCGVSTTFWGIMYGSFFGDMLATVSKTFGKGQLALVPVLMDPVKKPLDLLIMSIAFGLVHILTAIAIKFCIAWRSGDRLGAVFDSGFWFALLLGTGVLAAGAGLGIEALKSVGTAMAAVSAAGLVLTQGRDKKNPVMKLFGGVLSLYDITSYVGDILSYSRLMALGLATGVIASVVNVLASLGGAGVVGAVTFVLISVFGHALNFSINMLGAYVHTNRLQYVEFYQKFYEGGGRKYKPLAFNTKYYEFK